MVKRPPETDAEDEADSDRGSATERCLKRSIQLRISRYFMIFHDISRISRALRSLRSLRSLWEPGGECADPGHSGSTEDLRQGLRGVQCSVGPRPVPEGRSAAVSCLPRWSEALGEGGGHSGLGSASALPKAALHCCCAGLGGLKHVKIVPIGSIKASNGFSVGRGELTGS